MCQAKARNLSLMAEFRWREHRKREAKWAVLLRRKYFHNQNEAASISSKPCASNIRRALVAGDWICCKGIRHTTGSKSGVSFQNQIGPESTV